MPKFIDSYPDWQENTVATFGRWSQDMLLPGMNPVAAKPQEAAARPVEFARYDDRLPILPSEEDGEVIKDLERQKTILRQFVNDVYCMLSVSISLSPTVTESECSTRPWDTEYSCSLEYPRAEAR